MNSKTRLGTPDLTAAALVMLAGAAMGDDSRACHVAAADDMVFAQYYPILRAANDAEKPAQAPAVMNRFVWKRMC